MREERSLEAHTLQDGTKNHKAESCVEVLLTWIIKHEEQAKIMEEKNRKKRRAWKGAKAKKKQKKKRRIGRSNSQEMTQRKIVERGEMEKMRGRQVGSVVKRNM